MKNEEVSRRYARAVFELARESKSEEKALEQLREVHKAIASHDEIAQFFSVSVVSNSERRAVLEELFRKFEFSPEVRGLLVKLAEKGRFANLDSVVNAFQHEVDLSNKVVRGTVRSAAPLWPEERKKLETKISEYTGKKAVLDYQEDKSLLGGLVAQVGSLTFDDSLETQLRLIKEDLKRRAN